MSVGRRAVSDWSTEPREVEQPMGAVGLVEGGALDCSPLLSNPLLGGIVTGEINQSLL